MPSVRLGRTATTVWWDGGHSAVAKAPFKQEGYMRVDISIPIEDLLEPTEEEDANASRGPVSVAEATEAWEPPT
jgi:hypothetical protein